LKQLGFVIGLGIALEIGVQLCAPTQALAQDTAGDQTGAVTVTPVAPAKSWFQKKLAGSFVALGTYVGTGTFYVSGYRNPFLSNVLFLRPIYQLGTKYNLTLNGRFYLEEEYTQPDNVQARRLNPFDAWLWLAAKNLYTEPRSKIRIGGTARLVLPTSYESRYAHLIGGVTAGGSATRPFEFGAPDARGKRWELALTLGTLFTKNLHTSVLRGNGPGDSTGCLASSSLPAGASASGSGGVPAGAGSDRCGGPLNTSFELMTTGAGALKRGRFDLSVSLSIINQFRYSAPVDAFSATDTPLGREDRTWGIVSLGYEITPHLGVVAGVASLQPALDARYRYPRFPFFDFSGANANNFTQFFVQVSGTL
jgi:hypothetical protein